MKKILPILIVAIIVFLVIIYLQNQKQKTTKTLTFELPRSSDPAVFGSAYWNAFHTIANNIPCGVCKGFGQRFVIFFHDMVNLKLGKTIYDKENFDYFTDLIARINKGEDVFAEKTES